MKTQSLIYYTARVFQRFALCLVVGATALYWTILVYIAASVAHLQQLQSNELRNPEALDDTIRHALDLQSLVAVRWIIFAAALTAGLLLLKRYRTYEKPMIVDSIVIIAFCALSVTFAQSIVRTFVSQLAV